MTRLYGVLRTSYFVCVDGHISDRARWDPETETNHCSYARNLSSYGLVTWCSSPLHQVPLTGTYRAALLLGGAEAAAAVMVETGLLPDRGCPEWPGVYTGRRPDDDSLLPADWSDAYKERRLIHPAYDKTLRAARMRRRNGFEPLGAWSRRLYYSNRSRGTR